MNPLSAGKESSKKGRWWIGLFVGNFAYSLVSEPEFLHVALGDRQNAAREAMSRTFRHRLFWAAVIFLIAATAGLGFLDRGGAIGVGLALGTAVLQWSIYHFGLPHYQETLRKL